MFINTDLKTFFGQFLYVFESVVKTFKRKLLTVMSGFQRVIVVLSIEGQAAVAFVQT